MNKYLKTIPFLALSLFAAKGTHNLVSDLTETTTISIEKMSNSLKELAGDNAEQAVDKKLLRVNNSSRVVGKFYDYSSQKKNQILEFMTIQNTGIAFDVSDRLYKESFLIDSFALSENFTHLYVKYEDEMEKVKKALEKAELLIAQKNQGFEEEYNKMMAEQNAKLFGSNVEKPKMAVDNKVKIGNIEINKVTKQDVEKHKLASNNKVKSSDKKSNNNNLGDDFVFFDYSKEKESKKAKKKLVKNNYNPFLPATYAQRGSQAKPVVEKSKDIVKTSLAAPERKQKQSKKKSKQVSTGISAVNSSVTIRPMNFKFNKGFVNRRKNTEFRSDYSDAQRFVDYNTGEITIEKNLNGEQAFISGRILSSGMVDTKVTLKMIKSDQIEFDVPVFSIDDFEELLVKNKYETEGGFLLIDLDSATDKVEIDASYEKVVFLNSKMRQVKKDGDYQYVLYLGIEEGTTTIEYLRNGFEKYRKVVNVEMNTVTFDINFYTENKNRVVTVNQQNVMSQLETPLSIQSKEIEQFNSDNKVRKISTNKFNVGTKKLPLGIRQYVKFNHLSRPLFVGLNEDKTLTIPSEDYLGTLLQRVGIDDLSNVCMIQIDLDKPAKDIFIEGKSGEEYLNVDRVYQNANGTITDNYGPLTRKVFLLSAKAGEIHFGVNYNDGSEDVINSICSIESYIIEKL